MAGAKCSSRIRSSGGAPNGSLLRSAKGLPAGLKADGLRWQGIAQVYQQKQAVPDVVERYAATHSGGGRLVVPQSIAPRPPDVSDAALAARYGSTATGQSSGFDWNDWAIGIGTGIGLALLLGAAFLMGRQLRHPVQTA